MPDIETRGDIQRLMETFYGRVLKDEVIGYLFTDVAQMDLAAHLPVICDFWECLLFQTGSYSGAPMHIHQDLHEKSPLRPEHFERWLTLFCSAVDETFDGDCACRCKKLAGKIARSMSGRLNGAPPPGIQLAYRPLRPTAEPLPAH